MGQELLITGDNSHTVYSSKFGAHYHSLYGAIDESVHVFISAGLYHLKRLGYKQISIFEMGLGTGLNVLLTYIEASNLKLSVRYEGIESDPLDYDMLKDLNYPSSISHNRAQAGFEKIHQGPWGTLLQINHQFSLKKINAKIETHQLREKYHLVYFDAFAPSAQDNLWQEEVQQKIYNAIHPGGCLVTYCTQGAFRRTLKACGYFVEKLNGPGKKREMLRATKPSI